MVKAISVIEEVVKQKKRVRSGKNRKKAWRKNDLTEIEQKIEEQQKDERLGVLGEKTENLFQLDYDESDSINTNVTDEEAASRLRYVLDPATGLKYTGKKKPEGLVEEHRFLAGLPGHAGFSEKPKKKLKASDLKPKRVTEKRELKRLGEEFTAKASKAVRRSAKRYKCSADDEPWNQKVETDPKRIFIKDHIDQTDKFLGKKPLKRHLAVRKPNLIEPVPIPHEGVSYNPPIESHQALLKKATIGEMKKVEKQRSDDQVKSVKFPLGALPANVAQSIADMVPKAAPEKEETKESNTQKKKRNKKRKLEEISEEKEEEKEEVPEVLKPGRLTHQDRMKKKKKSERRQVQRISDRIQQRVDEFENIDEYLKEFKSNEERLKKRKMSRKLGAVVKKHMAPRFFRDEGVAVALGDELSSNLRGIVNPTNPVGSTLDDVYRRGLLPVKRNKHNRVGRTALRLPRIRKLKSEPVNPVTAEEILGKGWDK